MSIILDPSQSFIFFFVLVIGCLAFILISFTIYDLIFGPLSKDGLWGKTNRKPFDQQVD
jgi:hypothetical protein